jgi:streptogramin lyase
MTEDHNTPYYWVTTWGKGIVRFDPKAQDTDKMFGLQTVDNASSNSDTRKLHHIIQDSVKGYLWVTAADNLYAYKINHSHNLV